jgi:hypothetical protein
MTVASREPAAAQTYVALGAHLVGSVPLPDAETVFRTLSSGLGERLRRLPDGETGPSADWIVWQYPVLSAVGTSASDEAAADRLDLLRAAIDVIFGGRPTFRCSRTYISATRAAIAARPSGLV